MNKTKKELLVDITKLKNIIQDVQIIQQKIIFDTKEQEDLKVVSRKLEKWSLKLNNPKYEVAIIGLEKAGKSTMANALLNNNYFPSAIGRCTFTTARIESDECKDEAVVEFYSTEEFLQRFDALCEKIKLPKLDFETLTESKLNVEVKKKEYAGEEPNEIKDMKIMIQNRESIYSLLDQASKLIINDIKESVKPYIIGEDKAMAVKNIIIKSTELKDMKDVIIYDVPGFDSPTKLHLAQATKYTNEADVIIMMISIADKVSFTDPQVNFLNQVDNDGISLIDKTIVVASKFDKHIINNNIEGTKEEIEEYIDVLTKELKKYNIFREKNIFRVSPQGYLEKNGKLEKHPTKGFPALSKLQSVGFDDGFEVFRKRLSEFFEGEALTVLNGAVKKDINDIENFLIDFKTTHNPVNNETKYDMDLSQLKKEYRLEKKESLINLVDEYREIIKEKNDFNINEELKQEIEDKWINKLKITDEQRKKDIKKLSEDNVEKVDEYSTQMRTKLYDESLKIITELVADIVVTKDTEVIDNFKNGIYDIYEIKENKELKVKLDDSLNTVMGKWSFDERSYKPLLVRFINDIFKLLIGNRVTSNKNGQRVKAYKHISSSILALLPFEENYENESEYGEYEKTFIKKILVQYEELSIESIRVVLEEYSGKLKDKINIDVLTEEIKDTNISLSTLKRKLQESKDSLNTMSKDMIISLVNKSKPKNSLDILMTYANEATTYEEVQKEINKDLEILKEIISKVLLKAMMIEKPFLESINEQVESIRRDLRDGDYSTLYDFMDINIKTLDKERYSGINADPETNKKVENIIYNINALSL